MDSILLDNSAVPVRLGSNELGSRRWHIKIVHARNECGAHVVPVLLVRHLGRRKLSRVYAVSCSGLRVSQPLSRPRAPCNCMREVRGIDMSVKRGGRESE
jgi:hypothetical protein